MNLNDLLIAKGLDPKTVLVMRHRPHEPTLNRVFPWIAADRSDLFDAYQRGQSEKVESAMAGMVGNGFIAAFIAHGAAKAIFVSLYEIKAAEPITPEQYWAKPENGELQRLGMAGPRAQRSSMLWFDLPPVEYYADWKGKLIIDWPPRNDLGGVALTGT